MSTYSQNLSAINIFQWHSIDFLLFLNIAISRCDYIFLHINSLRSLSITVILHSFRRKKLPYVLVNWLEHEEHFLFLLVPHGGAQVDHGRLHFAIQLSSVCSRCVWTVKYLRCSLKIRKQIAYIQNLCWILVHSHPLLMLLGPMGTSSSDVSSAFQSLRRGIRFSPVGHLLTSRQSVCLPTQFPKLYLIIPLLLLAY